jgi:chitodextrinase
LANVTATTYGVTGLTRGTSYTFYVKAKDTSGNASTGVSITTTATDTTAPNNVTNLATSNVTATSLTLSWTASTSTDVASYDVYNGATLLGNTTSTTYGVTGLTGNTSYTFYVKAKDQAGNIASGTSVSVTTQVPINVIASDSFNSTGLLAGSSTDSYQGGTAKTWAVSGSGAYSTNGTTAYCSTVAASNHNVAYIDTGYASGSCEILLSTQDLNGSSGPKICFRIQDSENMLVCSFNDTSIDVYSYVGGSSSSNLGTYQVVTKSGDLIKVTTSGTNIKVFLNGTQVISCTDTTTFTSNTKWGFTAYKQPNARIDNFVFSV